MRSAAALLIMRAASISCNQLQSAAAREDLLSLECQLCIQQLCQADSNSSSVYCFQIGNIQIFGTRHITVLDQASYAVKLILAFFLKGRK